MFREYIKLEGKRIRQMSGRIFAGSLISLLAVLILGFGCIRLAQKKDEVEKMKIAVSIEHASANKASLAVNLVKNLEGINTVCEFLKMDLDQGYRALDDGEILGIIHIPDEFVEGVMDGRNIPAQIIYKRNTDLGVSFFRLLTQSAVDNLSAAQAGVYAVEDFCDEAGLTGEDRSEALNEINMVYLNYAFGREQLFKEQESSVTGSLSVFAYYGIAGVLFYFLLLGASMSALYYGEPDVFVKQMKRKGISKLRQHAVKGGLTFAIFFLFAIVVSVIAKREFLSLAGLAAIFAVAAFGTSFTMLIYAIAKEELKGILLLILSGLMMLFVSGGCVPKGYLSEHILKLSSFLPFKYEWQMVEAFLEGGTVWNHVSYVMGFAALCLVFACFILSHTGNSHRIGCGVHCK